MKTTLATIVLTAFVLQSSLAAPQSISINFDSIGKEILQGIENIVKSGSEAAQNFAENVQSGTEEILKDTEQYGEQIGSFLEQSAQNLTAAVESFITNLQNQINSVRNNVKRHLLQDIQIQLERLNETTEELQHRVGTVRQRWNEEISTEEIEIMQLWNAWASEQLSFVDSATEGNEEKVIQAGNIVNEYINNYGNQLSNCVDDIDNELDAYEIRVHQAIESAHLLVQSLLQQVQTCLQYRDSASGARKCESATRQPLRQLGVAAGDLARLNIEGASLLVARFNDRLCVIQTLAEFELGKYGVQLKINEIVAENNEEENEEADGDSSTTASAK